MMAVFIATFMTSVEVTIVTTALPSIISELHGISYQSWIMSAYLLTTAVTTPVYGKMADSSGRKRVFLWGVFAFTLGSFMSGMSPNIYVLIVSRAIQGIGAGAVMPLTFTIIADYYSFQDRARVMAYNNTAWGLSALIGPLLGGFLVDQLSWHWVFFVNVPLGIIVLVLSWIGYHESPVERKRVKFDWVGISLLSLTLVSLLLAVQSLDSAPVIALGLLILTTISLVALIKVEKRPDISPLISPEMFENPSFGVQIITAAVLSGVLIAYQVYFPMWLQSIYRLHATVAGLVVSSSSIMWLLTSFFVGTVIAKFVPKYVSIFVCVILLIVYSVLVFAGLNFPSWAFYIIAMFNGGCIGAVISMNTILSQRFVDQSLIASATSLLTLGRTLGQTIMTAVFGAVLNLVISAQRGAIKMSEINNAISANGNASGIKKVAIDTIILHGMHSIFAVVVVLLIIVLITNIFDPNKKIVR